MKASPYFRWQDHFVSYWNPAIYYIYCDTNASFASIHQHLENGFGKPCVVANGNGVDAGVCMAVSYEAKSKGVRRGSTLRAARAQVEDLVVYQSCLPLYEIYASLYDLVLGWIVPERIFSRGSNDEVLIAFEKRAYPYQDFRTAVDRTIAFIEEQITRKIEKERDHQEERDVLGMPEALHPVYAVCCLVRDMMWAILGLPVSIAVAPSVCLAKALVSLAKPVWKDGGRVYKTRLRAIAFPHNAEEANTFLRALPVCELCGAKESAARLAACGIRLVADMQDCCDIESAIRKTRNTHQGKVIWYGCHGRDDVLPGYLSALARQLRLG